MIQPISHLIAFIQKTIPTLCLMLLLGVSAACSSGQTNPDEKPADETAKTGETNKDGKAAGTETAGDAKSRDANVETGKTDANCIAGDCKNGIGTYVYHTGDKYIGSFKDGYRHGAGKFEYANGDTFEGTFDTDLKNGPGRYVFKNGDVLEGMFKDGKLQGEGKYTWKQDGAVYKGEINDGGNSGSGTLRQDDRMRDCSLNARLVECQKGDRAAPDEKKVEDSTPEGDQ